MSLNEIIALVIGAYLLGSIPFGKLIAKSYGIDIQKRGSGNIGFANMRRIVGWRAGIITLAADITKGYTPTLLAVYYLGTSAAFYIGITSIIGHIFPVWLKFRGGKGIATGLGVIFALQPIAGLIGVLVYVISCHVTRVSSRSSVFGIVAAGTTGILLSPSTWWQYIALLLIAVWTLRHNLTGKVANYDT